MWFTTSHEHPTIALNVSWSNGGQKTEEATAPAVELVDIDDEIERERGGGYASTTDSDDGINPTNATPVKPRHRVGIPPSPGDVLTPLRTPVRVRGSDTDVKKPAKSSPHVKIPPSPALNN